MLEPKCPFCGGIISVYTEPPCGNHPGVTWFMVIHDCDNSDLSIEMLQEGGSIDTVYETLNNRA